MNLAAPIPGEASPAVQPSPEAASRALRILELRIVKTLLAQTLSTARLRLSLVAVLSLFLWFGLFLVSREGFVFLRNTVSLPIHDQIVHAVFNTFFFTLLVMLGFSSSIILYGSLFRSVEARFLLTLPVRDERIFLHKFQQAVVLSSWGFLLLGTPMLLAYGIVARAPWYYYGMLLPLMVSFVYIPVAIGAIACMHVMYRLPRKRVHVALGAAAVLLAAAIWCFWSVFSMPSGDVLTPRWFQDMIGRLQLTEQRLLPNWWLSSGLLEAADGSWSEGVLFLTLMVANALFFRQVAGWTSGAIYRRAYSRTAGAGTVRKRVRGRWLDPMLSLLFRPLPPAIRLMLIKDLRLFRRDPVQWTQFLILFGLLALYFLNVHPFGSGMRHSTWISMVSFMNLSVVGLLMSTFTTRFIFPMVSLEGRRFWLLGQLPLPRDTILWSKFLFALGSLLIPCSLLVLLSDVMLHVPAVMTVNHQFACWVLCPGLSGIAVGLGARLPNLREQSPSRIAAGFGGTLNLVLSAIYIVTVLGLLSLPYHLKTAVDLQGVESLGAMTGLVAWLPIWLTAGTVVSPLLGLLATAVPLWIGVRALRRLEF